MSVLLRPTDLPPAPLHLLTAAAGLAARQACVEVGGFSPDLKWPNDLLVGERKLAGILAEAAGGAVVVGMGLQRARAPRRGGLALDEAAGRRVDRAELLVAWLRALDGLPRAVGRGGRGLPGGLRHGRPAGAWSSGPAAALRRAGRGDRRRRAAGRPARRRADRWPCRAG